MAIISRRRQSTLLFILAILFLTVYNIAQHVHLNKSRKEQENSNTDGTDKKIVMCPVEFRVQVYDYEFKQIGQEPSMNNRTDYNILILTPFSDSVTKLTSYFQLICALTYPHERISIGIGIDKNFDTNRLREAVELANRFVPSFRSVVIYQLEQKNVSWTHDTRHTIALQRPRRAHMALGRNELLFNGLRREHDWVLWLDADMAFFPPEFIQLLLSPNQPIVSPACVRFRPFNTYDRNIWRETPESRAYIAEQKRKLGDDFLMIEAYEKTRRIRIVNLKDEGKVVPIDGVGGCSLLVKASCHRQGLIFPSFVLDSHIETEGLAKMAAKMGFPVYGLPYVQVFHMTDDP
jgi:hypothetical protein